MRIARNTRLVERLVEKYAILYRRYSSLPECATVMARLRERLAYLLIVKCIILHSKGRRERNLSIHDLAKISLLDRQSNVCPTICLKLSRCFTKLTETTLFMPFQINSIGLRFGEYSGRYVRYIPMPSASSRTLLAL